MKPLFFLIALCLPGLAFANDCPKGSNVKLTHTTTASQVEALQASSSVDTAKSTVKNVKNHFPH